MKCKNKLVPSNLLNPKINSEEKTIHKEEKNQSKSPKNDKNGKEH